MLGLIVFSLSVFGAVALVNMLVRRTFLSFKPFNCALCMGFWIGLLMAWRLNYDPIWAWALIGASTSWILNKYVTDES